MKKLYRIILLLLALFFLTTYSPTTLDLNAKKNNKFFNIKSIEVVDNFLIKKNNIHKKLDKIYDKNIFLIKKENVERSLQEIDFLDKIEVKKKYPSTIIVKIFETTPIGIIIKDKKKYLLDSSSNLIAYEANMNFEELPNIFGDEAENNFLDFVSHLKNNNFPVKKIKKSVELLNREDFKKYNIIDLRVDGKIIVE